MDDPVETSESSKPVVRCRECGYCALLQEAGFTGQVKRFCIKLGSKDDPMEVEPSDGCTFGEPGEPVYTRLDYDVQLGGDAAVNGCHCDEAGYLRGKGGIDGQAIRERAGREDNAPVPIRGAQQLVGGKAMKRPKREDGRMKTLTCECGWTFKVDSTNYDQLENEVVTHLMSCHVVFEDDFIRDVTRIHVKEKSATTVCPVCGQERKLFDMREWIREDGEVAKICTGCSDTICAAFGDREEDRE